MKETHKIKMLKIKVYGLPTAEATTFATEEPEIFFNLKSVKPATL